MDKDEIRKACEQATPGPWVSAWNEADEEADRFTAALALSAEADPHRDDPEQVTSSTAWRILHGDLDGDEWENVGFIGNGQTSRPNAIFIAGAREWVPALLAENDELREAVARMECDCLPYAKPGDGQCDRCALLGEV